MYETCMKKSRDVRVFGLFKKRGLKGFFPNRLSRKQGEGEGEERPKWCMMREVSYTMKPQNRIAPNRE